MKKLLLTGLAVAGLTVGASAQGWFNLDTSSFLNNGVAEGSNTGWYTGTAGFEVWELNGTTAATINAINTAALTSGAGAYALLAADGFKLEATLVGQSVSSGTITLGPVKMGDVSPAGSTVTIALAAWDSGSATWTAAVGGGAKNAGVIAMSQPTTDYSISPNPPPSDMTWNGGMSQNLVMLPVPEPSTFALAGLGAAALLIFRRRK